MIHPLRTGRHRTGRPTDQWSRLSRAMTWVHRTLTLWMMLGLIATASGPGHRVKAWAQERRPVELELVLAIDTSSSVSVADFELQKHGLSEAFRHPDVLAAIQGIGERGIAVALVQWSGNRMQRTSVDWMVLHDAASAGQFASAIAASHRMLTGSTGLGGAIRFALTQLEENRFDGRRKVIDVSGDGYSGINPSRERDRAVVRGVTINGLAILNEKPDLGEYYARHVIGGVNAFVLTVHGFEDFGQAIREKLIKEVEGLKVAGIFETMALRDSLGAVKGSEPRR